MLFELACRIQNIVEKYTSTQTFTCLAMQHIFHRSGFVGGRLCKLNAGDFKSADLYADMAIRHNRYNAKALVNKGNCLFMSKEYGRAKEIFLEAIGVEVRHIATIGQRHPCQRNNETSSYKLPELRSRMDQSTIAFKRRGVGYTSGK